VIVVGVVRGGPAHRAGMQAGDLIVSIDGKQITEAREALLAIAGRKPGDHVKLLVRRNGKELALEATAIERPARAALTE
jgi:S1-C subfamily serine protease